MLDELLQIMDKLLSETGCPWDREQTHESLRENMLEESYEAIEAINTRDMTSLKEELGDVLLQVVFHAKIAEKSDNFTMEDIIENLCNKLISRHTHIFGEDKATDAADALRIWESNKMKNRTPVSAIESIPKALPALVRAAKVLKHSPEKPPSQEALVDDIKAALEALSSSDTFNFEIFGNILLQMVNLSAFLGVNAEFSLTNAIEGFINTNIQKTP
ncbi:MAG: MazG family protein [Defluviitaleaceae bacterium]|nr:MazG family protein [Defluviitaleaceae bacterium]